ncbi:hypothetical protein U9M48_005485 [Paspalum notatum var. saurae]|uniref:Uncharacterized protein n=1 Tax=Paspalum notatum var. saurae TaxID=547442 RepID=A0AAQ3SFI1_PASNO
MFRLLLQPAWLSKEESIVYFNIPSIVYFNIPDGKAYKGTKVFSMHDQWNCYRASAEEEGQEGKWTRSKQQQIFSMRKCSVLQKGREAQVSMSGCSTSSDSAGGQGGRPTSFWVDGCFRRRSCKIRSGDGEEVARVTRKKAEAAASSVTLGDDVFSLVIQPGVDSTMVMAFVVVLDRICWKPYTPMICSSYDWYFQRRFQIFGKETNFGKYYFVTSLWAMQLENAMHPVPPRTSPTAAVAAATTRVHPSETDAADAAAVHQRHHGGRGAEEGGGLQLQPAVYTVWKRSSMGFQGTDGFSVYDAAGALAFRVDNYSRRRRIFAGELLLMDGHGAPLLALKPQILSMRDQWNCYRATEQLDGDKQGSCRRQQLFSMRKCSLVKSTDEAQVYMTGPGHTTTTSSAQDAQAPSFRIQGSFWRRSCKIRSGDGEEVARITRKKAGAALESVTLGEDVFSLTVMPNADCAMIMAFVVIMDRICQKPYKPLMCSS